MSKDFEIVSNYKPSGDQPTAIKQLLDGLDCGLAHQTLLGVPAQVKHLPLQMSLKHRKGRL